MLGKWLKKHPRLWEYYRHLERRRLIRTINQRKKMTWEKQLQLVEKTYQERVGHPLDWDNLQTYTEKMQWAKMYDADPRKSRLSDKFAVREWVAETIGEEHLIPLLGCWDSFDEIDFDALPNQFVLKTNNGSGTNLIVKDKSKLNLKQTRRLVQDWLDTDFAYYNPFEHQYTAIPPKIIAEQFMVCDTGDLPDYKFLCFNGKPHFCWVDKNRHSNHTCDFFDMEWRHQPWSKYYFKTSDTLPSIPAHFDEMKNIVTALCADFSHVRVDLYNINGKIYFGEMTFTYASGYSRLSSPEADLMLGDLWQVDTTKRDKGYNV